jgi:hypothetical protein
MTDIVITGLTETQKGISQIRRNVQKTTPLFNRFGRALRDDARRRITTQDGGKYDKLSKWTRARTGRRKALITERKNISHMIVGSRLLIGHTATGWNIAMHEKGFTTPGFSGRTVVIPLKNPAALRDVKKNFIAIRGAKESVVPARKVFANKDEALTIMKPIITDWLNKIIKRAGAK